MPAVIAIPPKLLVFNQSFGHKRFDTSFMGGSQGDTETQVYGPPRWKINLTAQDALDADAHAVWTSVMLKLEGKINRLAVYDFATPEPLGDFRPIAPTLSVAAAAGATSMTIWDGTTAWAGKKLKSGSWIGVNQAGLNRQVVKVVDDATADAAGKLTVNFRSYLRYAIGAGSAVELFKPTWLAQMVTEDNDWSASGVVQGGISMDFIESWLA